MGLCWFGFARHFTYKLSWTSVDPEKKLGEPSLWVTGFSAETAGLPVIKLQRVGPRKTSCPDSVAIILGFINLNRDKIPYLQVLDERNFVRVWNDILGDSKDILGNFPGVRWYNYTVCRVNVFAQWWLDVPLRSRWRNMLADMRMGDDGTHLL